jgi:hypothetical protein
MPTAITSSLNTTPQVPFILNSGSFFFLEVQQPGFPITTASFFPSFSAVPHPTQTDYSTLNGFYIDPDIYTYGEDPYASNRQCYRINDSLGGGSGFVNVAAYQGIPLLFYGIDNDTGLSIYPPIEDTLQWDGGGPNDVVNSSYFILDNWDSSTAQDYNIARIRCRIRIDADPTFPQRLYSGRLDIGLLVWNENKNYAPTGAEPINWEALTTRAFQPFLPSGPGGQTTDSPIVELFSISNIEIGPGLSGSFTHNPIFADINNSFFYDISPGVQFGLVARFSFLTDAPPPPPSQTPPELWLVSIAPNGTLSPVQKINDTPFVTGNNSFNKTIQLSSSFLQVEDYRLGIAVKNYNGLLSPYFSSLNITNFDLTTGVSAQTNTSDEVGLGSVFEENFTNNDWNALFGNAFLPRESQYFMDVDYSDSSTIGSSLTPINFDSIIEGFATKAPVQDYYYNLQRHTIPRYDGSRSNAPDFNSASNDDSGYGDEIVAGNPKPFVGYYTSKGGSTPEVMGKTIVNLDYIIDENLEVQVPALSDFTYNNQVQLFERGKFLYLDPDKNSVPFPLAGNSKYKIYRSGEYASPVVYSQTGSINSLYVVPTMSFFDITGSQVNINLPGNGYVVNVTDNSQTSFFNTNLNQGNNYAVSAPADINEVFGNYPSSFGTASLGRIRLHPSFSQVFNNNSSYISIPGSGYYDIADYFNLGPAYPEIATQPEYEIRFAADENLAFPIISVDLNNNVNGNITCIDIYVAIPLDFLSTSGYTSLDSAIVLNNSSLVYRRSSFLIRRWTPRAGYIYLDVDATLGKGIIKPEFITKGIEDKVSLIIKDLTDKGLIQ